MGSRQPSLRSRRLVSGVWMVVGIALLAGWVSLAATGRGPLAVLGLIMVGSFAFVVRGVDRRMRQQPVVEPVDEPTTAEGARATLTLRRLPAYRDSLAAYRVVVDGERVGKVRDSETVTV